jgi:catechol 2,3-dioxygenase-like lactoylglutathione lyase family enzyme
MAVTPVCGLSRIELVARDPDALTRFYVEAFGFAPKAAQARREEEKRIALRLGAQEIALVRPTLVGRPYPTEVPGWSPAFQHFAMIVWDMSAAMERLRACAGWSAISTAGPQRLPAATGGVTAFKFRDPEGHPLEFLAFPTDAAPQLWRQAASAASAAICLGVDHSAISVANVARSVDFYASLGFAQRGGSLNQGEEQARLDGVDQPIVDVVPLETQARPTPHLELLHYRGDYPRTGAVAFNDVAATRLVLAMQARGQPDAAQDPDGHWLIFEE